MNAFDSDTSSQRDYDGGIYESDNEEDKQMIVIQPVNEGLTPTAEQLAIIEFGASLPPRTFATEGSGKLVRITAAAGTGKTTTMELLCAKLVQNGHKVLYLVFNKKAQQEATQRFHQRIDSKNWESFSCQTMHAAAFNAVFKSRTKKREIEALKKITEKDFEIKDDMRTFFFQKIVDFIGELRPDATKQQRRDWEFNIDLVVTWIFRTLLKWMYSTANERDLVAKPGKFTFFSCVTKHPLKFGKPAGSFYVQRALEYWKRMWQGEVYISHDVYMKKAQLEKISIPSYTVILVDESQDLTQCQIDYFCVQQTASPSITIKKDVFVVGDAAQTVYSFRGARSRFLKDLDKTFTTLKDFPLTESFRFGKNIEAVANQILYLKMRSLQRNHFIHYKVKGMSKDDGIVTLDELPFPLCVIGRSNAGLFRRCIGFLAQYENCKISLAGKKKKYQTIVNQLRELLKLYIENKRSEEKEFEKYENYGEFVDAVYEEELTQYISHIRLIEKYKACLRALLDTFEQQVIEAEIDPNDADVIATTAHQAKGLEFDHVELIDDFTPLRLQPVDKKIDLDDAEFLNADYELQTAISANSDELNLWYVAVTRAKKRLRLNDQWECFQGCGNLTVGDYQSTQYSSNADCRSVAKFFLDLQIHVGSVPRDVGIWEYLNEKDKEVQVEDILVGQKKKGKKKKY